VLVVSSGNALLSPAEMAKLAPQDQISAILLEALSAVSTVLFQLQAAQQGVSVVSIPNYGGHTWANWARGLTEGRQTVMDALRATPPVKQGTTVLPVAQIGSTSPSSSTSDASSATSTTATTSVTPSTTAATSAVPGSVAASASAGPDTSSSESAPPSSAEASSQSADPSDSSVVTTTTTIPAG
jgi:diacylglycerol O-acyltransferase/trehalose O-mycolyltransferase